MNILDTQAWAQRTFATTKLGDKRRSHRAVQVAASMMRRPNAQLPQQMCSLHALKAAYRLLDEQDVTHEQLSKPHWDQTRRAAARGPLVLLVHDDTHVDHTHHPKTSQLGPIGDGTGQGYIIQSVLAAAPKPREVLGIAHQQPFLRQPVLNKAESSVQRRKRERESLVWIRAVEQIGSPPDPANMTWVHVADRYGDIFDFMTAARQQDCHFLVRVAQDRRVRTHDGELNRVLSLAANLSAQDYQTIELPPRPHLRLPARQARLALSMQSISLLAPKHPTLRPPHAQPHLSVWVVRVWEVDPPSEVQEPIEWVLLTSVPTSTVAQGWERRDWYSCRWLIEDYHHCLKTGCLLEERHLHTGERLMRLLGFLSPIAVRLLQLREIARTAPQQLAKQHLPQDVVRVVAALAEVPVERLTMENLWREVARQGGHLGRRRDGPPGWQTLWRGWLYIQSLVEGIHLAANRAHPPPEPG